MVHTSAKTSAKETPNTDLLQTVVEESSPLQVAAQLRPGMWVQVLYLPYVQGALGIITARENADRWLVTIPGDPQGEGLLLSLSAPEFLLATGMTGADIPEVIYAVILHLYPFRICILWFPFRLLMILTLAGLICLTLICLTLQITLHRLGLFCLSSLPVWMASAITNRA
ncbi:MAG: hypothetical protein ACUVRV_00465 [Cyanobacteriota bacterium]